MFKGCTPIDGKTDVEYDLNDPQQRDALGIAHDGKHADGYCHFTNCNWMVEERKGANHVAVALEQLESTVRQLLESKRKVTSTIIRMNKLSRSEQRRFFVDPRSHNLRTSKTAKDIRIPGVETPVKVIYEGKLDSTIADLREKNWVSVSV